MAKRNPLSAWARLFDRQLALLARSTAKAGRRAATEARKPTPRSTSVTRQKLGRWTSGIAVGPTGARRYRLFRPPDMPFGERVPMLVMLHGCGQDAAGFAASTRMNAIAARERFMVLYPEQDRVSNANGCWNWFDTASGRAYAEAALIMAAIDQVCALYAVDRARVAVAGLSAGASMAALLATRHPARFRAIVMHSGIPPGAAHSTWSAVRAMHGHGRTQPLPVADGSVRAAWPPLLVMHGKADHIVSPNNGQAAVQRWADAAGATPGTARLVQRGKRYARHVTDFNRQGRTVATLVEIAELGHAWSGGAATQAFGDRHGPDASRMVWAFAAKHFKTAAVAPPPQGEAWRKLSQRLSPSTA